MRASSKNSAPPQSSSPSRAPSRRLPPLKALLAFEAASRCGSFALGAEELGVTPSAVSHHIQQIEDFLGVKLFQRRAGRAVLTSAGQVYAAEIERAFGRIAEATDLVSAKPQARAARHRLRPELRREVAPAAASRVPRRHPETKVRLATLSGSDDLEAGDYDVAIAYGRPAQTGREVQPLLVERLRPVCSPALAAALQLQTPRDLSRATLIHSKNALTWADYLRRLDLADVRPANELWVDRSSMAIDAAVSGLGVVLESELLTERELADGRLVAPFDPVCSMETESYFLVKPSRPRGGARTAAFERWVHGALATAAIP